MIRRLLLVALCFVAIGGLAKIGEYTGTITSTRIYTPPDPNAPGGIHLQIAEPAKPVIEAVAIPQNDQKLCYKGDVSLDGHEVDFTGLPVAKYDLLILYDDEFYEGICLYPDASTLTQKDLTLIEKTLTRSVPFFDTKKTMRCEGLTGREGKAHCVTQWMRIRPVTLQSAEVRSDIQIRSLRLAHLEDVGEVGWTLTLTRELIRTEVGPKNAQGLIRHHRAQSLGGVRVTDSVKDLGTLSLKPGE